MAVGVLPPKGRLPEMPSHTNTHISGNGTAMSDGAVARVLVLEAPRRLVVREFPRPRDR